MAARTMQDVARYARRVRQRLGLSQTQFARRIHVPHEAIRNLGAGEALADRRCAGTVEGARQSS